MAAKNTNGKPGWGKVKSHISEFDHAGLVELIHDLYDASNENRLFLHARFGLGEDTLGPYKNLIERWVSPDNPKSDRDISVSKALKAISDYKKAVGHPEGLAELMVFYCEQAASFTLNFGMEGDTWFSSLVRTYANALQVTTTLPPERQEPLLTRLDRVREMCSDLGWGVGDDVNQLWADYGCEAED
jgi:hypothetical protein